MLYEKRYFIQCLSDFLNGRQSSTDEDVDWNSICIYAKQQQVEGIIYHQCKLAQLHTAYLQSAYLYVQRSNQLKQIDEEFSESRIEYIVLKGMDISSLYPIPSLRTMGDIDILVHEDDKIKAEKILIERNFNTIRRGTAEWIYEKNGIEIELHHCFLYDTSEVHVPILKQYSDNIWNNVEKGKIRGCIDSNYNLVLLFFHLRKHLMGEGVGFRQFMDIVVSSRNVDWTVVSTDLIRLNLWGFAQKCIAFCNHWFDMPIPKEAENVRVDKLLYDEVTEKIFAGGVFGYCDVDNQINHVVNDFQNNGNQLKRKIQKFIGTLFPPINEVKITYLYLNKCPLLLPVAWSQRMVASIKKGTITKRYRQATDQFRTEKVKKRQDYLKQWGL